MADLTFQTLPNNRDTLEKEKFELDSNGKVRVRTLTEGSFVPTGLRTGGRVTEIILSSTTWTPLPGTGLSQRNAISIQNQDATIQIKVNYDPAVTGYVGMIVGPNSERHYDVQDIVIYAKSASGNPVVAIEEIS